MEIKKIAFVGEITRTPDAPDHLGWKQGLENWEGLIVDPVLNPPDWCLEQIKKFKPDLVIHGNTDSLGQGLGRIMRSYAKKQVFFMGDYQPDKEHYTWWDRWTAEKGMYDAIFITNKDQLGMWSEGFDCPAYYLTHGCVVQPLVKDQRFYHKVLFVGGLNNQDWYKERADLMEKLQPFDHITGEGVEGRNEIWRQMPALYHTSDCVLDVSHSWKATGYASGRFFYTGGLGACSITKRFPDCEELYPKGTKAYFDSPEEAHELIKFYTTHEKEREEMKIRAWKHNKKHHNYKLKLEEIIRCIS